MALAHTDNVIAPSFDVTQLAGLDSSLSPLVGTLLTKYEMKRGLRECRKQGDDTANAEMRQLHKLKVLRPKPSSSLSSQDRHDALKYLVFLKRKRDGRVKGHGCADGRKQQKDAVKGDSSFPTIATESVLILLTIAAKEGRAS